MSWSEIRANQHVGNNDQVADQVVDFHDDSPSAYSTRNQGCFQFHVMHPLHCYASEIKSLGRPATRTKNEWSRENKHNYCCRIQLAILSSATGEIVSSICAYSDGDPVFAV